MEKHFMIDIETTGIDPTKEDLLQIGVLELDLVDRYWKPGRRLEIIQHSGRKPTSTFARAHMTALYGRCNATSWKSPEEIRAELLQFFKDCGANPPNVYLMGWNASNFDVPFLVHHRVLVPSSYAPGPGGKDVMVGDFHYRIYELSGAVSLAQNALDYEDRGSLLKTAKNVFEMELPAGKEHDALYDCYAQTQLLNGLITMTSR
jgi:DNA polymerase III epsilon subunit-like protein